MEDILKKLFSFITANGFLLWIFIVIIANILKKKKPEENEKLRRLNNFLNIKKELPQKMQKEREQLEKEGINRNFSANEAVELFRDPELLKIKISEITASQPTFYMKKIASLANSGSVNSVLLPALAVRGKRLQGYSRGKSSASPRRQKQGLNPRQKYVQIALNGSAGEALKVISALPSDLDRILIEAGTPLIKSAGIEIVSDIKNQLLLQSGLGQFRHKPYIVADMKVTDLADREVVMAHKAGASAVTCLGVSPVETIDNFIASCRKNRVDSMIDMMNVDNPILVLKKLKEQPDVVIVHRGVDETDIDKQKMIPYYQINQIKGNSESMVAVAGGDTIQEIRSAIFNNADIVVLWKAFISPTEETGKIIDEFLKEIR